MLVNMYTNASFPGEKYTLLLHNMEAGKFRLILLANYTESHDPHNTIYTTTAGPM